MVGTGLVTIPWAYANSGIALGIILTIVAFIISFTTQYFIMAAAGKDIDYTETLKKTFGKNGWYFGMVLFIIMLTIPILIFFQLLSQFLYPIILVCIELKTGADIKINFDMDFSGFSYSYTCFIVFVYLFILTARRDMSIFIKINTFGVIFTMIIICYIITVGIQGLSSTNYEYVMYKDNSPGTNYNNHLKNGDTEILLFAANYGPLMGILGGGFYLHNISLPIYRNSKNPENSVRDMFLGFLVVALSYIICGSLGALGFGSAVQFPDK